MATAVTVSATNNAEIDGLLSGAKWSGTITYSFPDSPSDYARPYGGGNSEPTTSGFASAPSQMQAAINYAIGLILGYTNANIQYAGTNGADIMVAQSPSANPTSYAYYPGNYASGGDIWFGTQYNYSLAALGNYYFTTALHELGHALGLKHSQETGGVANVAVPSAHDDSEYTVMSYRSYAGASTTTGYTNEAYGYPQTYMANDILALQTMYGANYTSQSGATVYTWSTTTGQEFINGAGQPANNGGAGGSANRIYETIWDGSGVDTYDLSNYTTNLSINLNPGASSVFSTTQLANLGNGHYASGNVYNAYLYNNDARSYIDNAIGGSGNDTIIGNAIANVLNGDSGNDTISGGGDNDTIVGGAGTDTLTGGAGADIFVFGAGDSSPASGQHDFITDFVPGTDQIDLHLIDAISSSAAQDAFRFIGGRGFDGSAGELMTVFDSTRGVTMLEGDTNGDKIADFIIDLSGNLSLSAGDLIGVYVNQSPVVTTANRVEPRSTAIAASLLFSVSDAENDPIVAYEFWDSTRDSNSGHFVVNGVVQAAGTVIHITQAQLAQTSFVTGRIDDALQVRAFDGTSWSAADNVAWAPFIVDVAANSAPVESTSDVVARQGQTLAVSSLFSVTDADRDSITMYQLWDSTRDPNSGHFEINGVAQAAGTVIEVTAAQLPQVVFVVGAVSDSLQIRAFDGLSWSAPDTAAWSPFKVNVIANHAPIVTTNDIGASHSQAIAASSLFSVTDADGDAIVKYQFWDSTRDPNSGHFEVNGVAHAAGTVLEVTAAQLAQTTFVSGAVSDSLQIRAFDGGSWSASDAVAWAPFNVNVAFNHAPVVAAGDVSASHSQTIAASSLFSVTDADGDTIVEYQFWDATRDTNSGHFVVNGVAQAAGTVIDITAAQLAQTSFVTGSVSDSIQVRAFDGVNWSAADNLAWAPFKVDVPANNAPVVTTSDINATPGQVIAASSLFAVTDADHDSMVTYQFWDSTRDANSGHFVVNGVAQAAGTVTNVTAAQLAQTTFVAGTVPDALQVRASDGLAWSAADDATWAPFHILV